MSCLFKNTIERSKCAIARLPATRYKHNPLLRRGALYESSIFREFAFAVALGGGVAFALGVLPLGGGEAGGSGGAQAGFDSEESLGHCNRVGYLHR